MEVPVSVVSGVPMLKVCGDIDHLTAPGVEKAAKESIGPDGLRLLLDLGNCNYIDRGGLSVLLSTLRRVKGRGWLGVVAPNPNILRLFEIVGLSSDPDFRIFASFGEATVGLGI
jgi:anti-anti-sigma factor